MAVGSCIIFSPNLHGASSGENECLQLWCNSQRSSRGSRIALLRIRNSVQSCVEERSSGNRSLKQEKNGGFFRPSLGWPVVPDSVQLLDELLDCEDRDGDSKDTADNKNNSSFMLSCGVEVESTPPPPRQKQEKGNDYHVNVGYAIRSLREEIPGMFYKEPTFDIYREDITFRDPLITFSGISNYKLMFWGLRFYGRIFFKAIWIEIQRIWQPRDKVIMVRWTVYGVPRVPWEARGQFDATSEYKLDSDGLIYEHKVDNLVMNSPPKYKAPAVIDMVVAAGGAQTPTPSYYMVLFMLFLERFTWVRYYLALRGTLVLSSVC